MRRSLVLFLTIGALALAAAGCGGSSNSSSSSQQPESGTMHNNSNGGTPAPEESAGAIKRHVTTGYVSTTQPGRQFSFTPNFAQERIQCTTPACYQPGSSQRTVAGHDGSQALTFDWPCEYFQPHSPPDCQSRQDRVDSHKVSGKVDRQGDRVRVLCQAMGKPAHNELGVSSSRYNLGVVPPRYLGPEFRATAMKAPDGHDYVAWFADIFDGNVDHHLPCAGALARYAQAASLLK